MSDRPTRKSSGFYETKSLAERIKLVINGSNVVDDLFKVRDRYKFGPDPFSAVELDRLYDGCSRLGTGTPEAMDIDVPLASDFVDPVK